MQTRRKSCLQGDIALTQRFWLSSPQMSRPELSVRISIQTAQAIDLRFRSLPVPQRSQLILRFQTEQPALTGYLCGQDEALFPKVPGRIFPIGCLAWNVFSVLGENHVPQVDVGSISELLGNMLSHLNSVEEDSEYRGVESVVRRFTAHPQPELLAYAMDLLKGRETKYEFIPPEIKAAFGHADVAIRALDRVVQTLGGAGS